MIAGPAGVPPAAISVPAATTAAVAQGSVRTRQSWPFMMITTSRKDLYLQSTRCQRAAAEQSALPLAPKAPS
jgi:hypothetical protein